MHEMSLCVQLLRMVAAEARNHTFHNIKSIRLEIGAWSCVEPRSLRFCFLAARSGTVAENAELIIDLPAYPTQCGHCAKETTVWHGHHTCSNCGAVLYGIGDKELVLKEMEVE